MITEITTELTITELLRQVHKSYYGSLSMHMVRSRGGGGASGVVKVTNPDAQRADAVLDGGDDDDGACPGLHDVGTIGSRYLETRRWDRRIT